MIINYLIKALCEKESVYVNNLGLFRKEYEPAQIKDGTITPPGYKLVYDPDYDGNGFAFTMFVSQKGSMLITEASTRIDQWVAQLKTALDNNKSVSFENFGTFAKNSHGIISFVCDRISELNIEYEGMEPVSFGIQKGNDVEEENNEVENEEVNEDKNGNEAKTEPQHNLNEENENKDAEENVEVINETSDTPNTEEKEEKEDEDGNEVDEVDEDNNDNNDDEDDEDDEDEDNSSIEKKKKRRRWIIRIILLLLLAALVVKFYLFREKVIETIQQLFEKEKTEITTEEPSQETPTPVIIDIIDTLSTDSLALDTVDISTATMEENIEEKEITNPATVSQLPNGEKFFIDYEQGKYYVIVGSFRSEKEVREHIKRRKLEQYNPKVVLQPKSKHLRICIAIFDSEEAADNYGRTTGLNYWVLK